MPTKKKTKPRGKKGGRVAQAGKDPAVLKKELEAFELRAAGYSYQEIADKLGYSHKAGAWTVVHRAIAYAQEHLAETVAEVLAQQLSAYRKVLKHLRPMVMAAAPSSSIINNWITVMGRVDKLVGLDNQINIQVTDSTKIIESLAAAGDREALREIAAGADPVQVAIGRLTRTAPPQPGSKSTH